MFESWIVDDKMDKSNLYGFEMREGQMVSVKVDNDAVGPSLKDMGVQHRKLASGSSCTDAGGSLKASVRRFWMPRATRRN